MLWKLYYYYGNKNFRTIMLHGTEQNYFFNSSIMGFTY